MAKSYASVMNRIIFFNGLFVILILIWFLSPDVFILAGKALQEGTTTMTAVNPTSFKIIAANSSAIPFATILSHKVLSESFKVISTTVVAKLPHIVLTSYTVTNASGIFSERILSANSTLNYKVSYIQPSSSKTIRGIDPPG